MHRIPPRVVTALLPLLLLAAAATADVDELDSDKLFDLDFKGGTVETYVDAIRGRSGDANIIVMQNADTVPVPAVQLRSVTVSVALSILDGLSHIEPDWSVELMVEEHHPEERVVAPEPGAGRGGPPRRVPLGNPVFVVHADLSRRGSDAPPPPAVSRVFAVGELLDSVSPEALLTAMQTSLDLIDEDFEPARIRFHEDTGLVIARGRPEQMNAISEVVENVAASHRQRQRLREHQADRERQEADLAELRVTLQATGEERDGLRREVMTLQTRMELLQRQLDETMARLTDAQHEKEGLMMHVHELEMELSQAREPRDHRE